MDLSDDVAYSVHDVEDGVVAGRIDLTKLTAPGERGQVWETVRDWYLPAADDAALDEALVGLQAQDAWPRSPYDGTRRAQAALKNLTSDLIGRFCGSVREATAAEYDVPLARYHAELVVPDETVHEIAALKGIAAHYVMRAEDRMSLQERQREQLGELVEVLLQDPQHLDPMFAADHAQANDDDARCRVVLDQVASLTDASAVDWHKRLVT